MEISCCPLMFNSATPPPLESQKRPSLAETRQPKRQKIRVKQEPTAPTLQTPVSTPVLPEKNADRANFIYWSVLSDPAVPLAVKKFARKLGYNTQASRTYVAAWLALITKPGGILPLLEQINCYCSTPHVISFRRLLALAPWKARTKQEICTNLGKELGFTFDYANFKWPEDDINFTKLDHISQPPGTSCNPYFAVTEKERTEYEQANKDADFFSLQDLADYYEDLKTDFITYRSDAKTVRTYNYADWKGSEREPAPFHGGYAYAKQDVKTARLRTQTREKWNRRFQDLFGLDFYTNRYPEQEVVIEVEVAPGLQPNVESVTSALISLLERKVNRFMMFSSTNSALLMDFDSPKLQQKERLELSYLFGWVGEASSSSQTSVENKIIRQDMVKDAFESREGKFIALGKQHLELQSIIAEPQREYATFVYYKLLPSSSTHF